MSRRPSSTSNTHRVPSRVFSGWRLIPVLLTCAALLLPLASILSPSAQTPGSVPYSMHSVLIADYSSEFTHDLHPALEVNIIREAILDQDGQADEARLAEIEDSLLTPVPTITPRFPVPATSAPQAQPTADPTRYSRPRATAVIPWNPEPTEAAATEVQPTATFRPAAKPTSTPSPSTRPKSTRPAPPPEPQPKPTEPQAKPTNPPDPYPQPEPGDGPPPNPYP